MSEAMAARWSDALVADNEGIAAHLAAAYGRQSTVIAYGGDHLPFGEHRPEGSDPSYDALMDCAGDCFLAVARCQPDNNIEAILDAFASSSKRLIFISNWKGSEFGRQMLQNYSQLTNVRFENAIYDVGVLGYLRRHCVAYIHGHSAGGTNPSLVEAMWGGRNCLCFDNQFNRFTTFQDGLFWRDAGELKCLLKLDYGSQDLVARALRLRASAERSYSWNSIVASYAKLLESMS
jgi:hypothetical protein